MSLDEKTGDTEYFASTDYNQRLEEKAEAEYANKGTKSEQSKAIAVNEDLETLIEQRDINTLYKIAAEPLADSDYVKLINFGDKDIHIQLARNENITDAVAEGLIGTVYLAHKALLLNPIVSEQVKAKLKERIKNNPTYANLL